MKRNRFVLAALTAAATLGFVSMASANVNAICVEPGTVDATLSSFNKDRVTTANVVATNETGNVVANQTIQFRGTKTVRLTVPEGTIGVEVSVGNSPDSPWKSTPVECKTPTPPPPPVVETPKDETPPKTEVPVNPKPTTPTCADLKARNAGPNWYKRFGYPVGCVKPKPPKKRLTCADIPKGAGINWYNGSKIGYACPLPPRFQRPDPILPPVTA